MKPQRPSRVPEYARVCLDALAETGIGRIISIGGAFGLAHYLDYRETRDVDAWWVEPFSREEREALVRTVEEALSRFGEVRTRSWGDVVSVDLERDGKAVFDFQIARRSAMIAEPVPSSWAPVRVDAFEDIIASKMAALVERGAPRDFRDVHAICRRGLATVERCWDLWNTRQILAGTSADRHRAALAARSHLARIEQARPLASIADPEDRAAAEDVRTFVTKELLRDLPD